MRYKGTTNIAERLKDCKFHIRDKGTANPIGETMEKPIKTKTQSKSQSQPRHKMNSQSQPRHKKNSQSHPRHKGTANQSQTQRAPYNRL